MLNVEEITDVRDLRGSQSEWSALAAASREGSPFETPEWTLTWLETFWAPRPIAFLLVREGESLVGLAPFLDDKNGVLACPRSLAFSLHPHVPHCSLITREDTEGPLSAVLEHLWRTRRSSRVLFARVRDTALSRDLFPQTARRQGFASCVFDESSSPAVRLDMGWPSYLESRSHHVRSELRRKRKRIEAAGAITFRTVTQPAECDEAMADIMAIERDSWKEDTRSSFTTGEHLAEFYRVLATRCAAAGWLRTHLLYLNSKPVAHLYGLAYRGGYWALKTSFCESSRSLSPGTLLFEHAIRDACDEKLAGFELLGVNSRWKRELANESRRHLSVCLYSRWSARCAGCRAYHLALKPLIARHAPILIRAKKAIEVRLTALHPRGNTGGAAARPGRGNRHKNRVP